ncbi:MAG: hypothetical protein DMG65_01340 [Candidatus Angelobacter sp. Gp1-AA117]|nr:MAG: hypothetical protein DMG65_01340 [Candidatus Angelobacter sp. Gp1-AA117]
MALGFGFNKTKVLSSAEKFVQQGKLQNAITEYEKVVREDPKDLTVLNTIGDLDARVGQNDRACDYFKRVGDQYAQNGFTVKAIAIYKKLTKLNPATPETITKLAELYTTQGLFNDARSQYMQVADQLLKSGDNNQAAKVFQKILELDPENTTTQSKLADLYIKLGKKEDARNIYYSAAESLYSRSSFDAADEALSRVLNLDPANAKALLLRGMIAAESGDSQGAIQYLEQVPDIDSRPDALRALLKAKLRSGKVEGLDTLANKLVSVHQDISGIGALAEWYLANNHLESALKLYDSYADRLLAHGPRVLHDTLYPLIGRIRTSPEALTLMLRLLQKAGDTSHMNEVMELLAHAYVQKGELTQARDLYKQLSDVEPENPLHGQNYKQMLAKLGEDAVVRPLSEEESSQAFMVEELEHAPPAVRQEYTDAVEKSLEAALTDAELFISYNVPLKAIVPLETALPLAPHDIALNQQLASLYVRADRFADAAKVCKTLSEVFAEAGHAVEAERYAEASRKYGLRAASMPAAPAPAAAAPPPPVTAPVAAPAVTPPSVAKPPEPVITAAMPVEVEEEPPASSVPTGTVKEFILDVPAEFSEEIEIAAPAAPAAPAASTAAFESPLSETAAPAQAGATHEVDLSHDWESLFSVDGEAAPAVAEEPAPSVPTGPDPAAVADKVQEVRFYISQAFWDIAHAAIADLEGIAPDNPELEQLKAALAEAQAKAEAPGQAATLEITPVEAVDAPVLSPEPVAVPAVKPEPAPPPEPLVQELVLEVPEEIEVPKAIETAAEPPKTEPTLAPPPVKPAVAAPSQPVAPMTPPVAASTQPVVPAGPPVAAPIQPVVAPSPQVAANKSEDVLGDFVLDLEESLGTDFLPVSQAQSVPVSKPEVPSIIPAAAASIIPVAADPLDSEPLEDLITVEIAASTVHTPAANPAPVMQAVSAPAPPASAPAPVMQSASAPAAAASNGELQTSEATSVLTDIFSDLQDEMQETEPEDPETHYNLGIAFKEMGLLDEAIGELQKVCHAVEGGNAFSQPIQAYTWLAQCLVDKGVPEAAVRWYEKALNLPGVDHDSRCSIYYDLGSAYESFGDKKAALNNFMEVYSSNIDFRDVATRIKVLKS